MFMILGDEITEESLATAHPLQRADLALALRDESPPLPPPTQAASTSARARFRPGYHSNLYPRVIKPMLAAPLDLARLPPLPSDDEEERTPLAQAADVVTQLVAARVPSVVAPWEALPDALDATLMDPLQLLCALAKYRARCRILGNPDVLATLPAAEQFVAAQWAAYVGNVEPKALDDWLEPLHLLVLPRRQRAQVVCSACDAIFQLEGTHDLIFTPDLAEEEVQAYVTALEEELEAMLLGDTCPACHAQTLMLLLTRLYEPAQRDLLCVRGEGEEEEIQLSQYRVDGTREVQRYRRVCRQGDLAWYARQGPLPPPLATRQDEDEEDAEGEDSMDICL